MSAKIDMTGRTVGRFTVIEQVGIQNGHATWLCKCECGALKTVAGIDLRSGRTQSCGCLNKEITSKAALIDLTGQTFGKLTVITRDKNQEGKKVKWLCRCECGKIVSVASGSLKSGHTKSCSCYTKKLITESKITHGQTINYDRSRFYRIWVGMKSRCYNPKHERFKDYGGRGIGICERWLKFQNFFNDMYQTYQDHVDKFGEKNTTIDRVNIEKGYSPENCRWATRKEQSNNRRKPQRREA